MKPTVFKITQGADIISSRSGIAFVGQLLSRGKLEPRVNQIKLPNRPRPEIANADVLKSVIALLSIGKTDFADIESLRDDFLFPKCLGLRKVPSEPTIRQRLDDADGQFDWILRDESAWMVAKHAPFLTPCHGDLVPLDVDVSVFDNSHSRKEGVGWTYKQVMGYAPIFAYLGLEGYLLNLALREGTQHCQKGTPGFLRQTIGLVRTYLKEIRLLARLDSGNDALENIRVCQEEDVDWLIKRNLRKESTDAWLKYAQKCGEYSQPRDGKQVWRGDLFVRRAGFDRPLRIVYEATLRTVDSKGQYLLVPDLQMNTFWTSLTDSPEKVCELYRDHGTSEQFHSELKSDMDLERLPSGKFATNALFLLLGMLAYNILRICGQEGLRGDTWVEAARKSHIRKPVKRRRIRNIIQDLMYLGCRVIRHARRVILSFGAGEAWYPVWGQVYLKWSGG